MLQDLLGAATDTLKDMLPIALVVLVFQGAVLRQPPPRLGRILVGVAHIFIGLTLFRLGLALSLLPVGSHMAEQLTQPVLVAEPGAAAGWYDYYWLYAFAGAIGFSATLVEPTLAGVAERVREMTGGALRPWSLRVAASIGIALGTLLGTLRIVIGIPLEWMLLGLILLIAMLVRGAPRGIIALAFDSGAVSTSVVTVPLIAAFAVGIAQAVPGRDPLADGFGVVFLALLGPMVTVLAFGHARGGTQVQRRGDDDAL